MSDLSLKHEVENSPSTSHLEDPNFSSKECAVYSDDDDEFGNFEEASVSCDFETNKDRSQSGSIDQCEFAENCRRASQTSNTPRLPKLYEIIDDSSLWEDEDYKKDYKNGSEEHFIYDLFRKFDFCDNESTSGTERDLRLCYVEDTAALNFLWNNSVAYLKFLRSLKMNINKFGDHSALIKKAEFPASTDGYSINSGSRFFVKKDASNFETSPEIVDSLSVPPVSFDWQTSGLSNPLTGSSMPAISAVLQCDFFNGDVPQSSQCNGQSILQKELDALGLNETSTARTPINLDELVEKSCGAENGFKNTITESNHLTPKINNSDQQNEENNHQNLSSTQPMKLKSLCENSNDACYIRERIPTNSAIGSRLASPIKNE